MKLDKETGGSLEALDPKHGLGGRREEDTESLEEVDESLPVAHLKALGLSSNAAEGFMVLKPPGDMTERRSDAATVPISL